MVSAGESLIDRMLPLGPAAPAPYSGTADTSPSASEPLRGGSGPFSQGSEEESVGINSKPGMSLAQSVADDRRPRARRRLGGADAWARTYLAPLRNAWSTAGSAPMPKDP